LDAKGTTSHLMERIIGAGMRAHGSGIRSTQHRLPRRE
jgi:hypothetical protein